MGNYLSQYVAMTSKGTVENTAKNAVVLEKIFKKVRELEEKAVDFLEVPFYVPLQFRTILRPFDLDQGTFGSHLIAKKNRAEVKGTVRNANGDLVTQVLYEIHLQGKEDQFLDAAGGKDLRGVPFSCKVGNLGFLLRHLKRVETIFGSSEEEKKESLLEEFKAIVEGSSNIAGQITGFKGSNFQEVVSHALSTGMSTMTATPASESEGVSSDMDSNRIRMVVIMMEMDAELLKEHLEEIETKGTKLTIAEVEREMKILSQFCDMQDTRYALRSIQYETDYVFASGVRVPPWREVHGELAYIVVRLWNTEENAQKDPESDEISLFATSAGCFGEESGNVVITAHRDGYFVNGGICTDEEGKEVMKYDPVSKTFPSLVALLRERSPHFNQKIDHQDHVVAEKQQMRQPVEGKGRRSRAFSLRSRSNSPAAFSEDGRDASEAPKRRPSHHRRSQSTMPPAAAIGGGSGGGGGSSGAGSPFAVQVLKRTASLNQEQWPEGKGKTPSSPKSARHEEPLLRVPSPDAGAKSSGTSATSPSGGGTGHRSPGLSVSDLKEGGRPDEKRGSSRRSMSSPRDEKEAGQEKHVMKKPVSKRKKSKRKQRHGHDGYEDGGEDGVDDMDMDDMDDGEDMYGEDGMRQDRDRRGERKSTHGKRKKKGERRITYAEEESTYESKKEGGASRKKERSQSSSPMKGSARQRSKSMQYGRFGGARRFSVFPRGDSAKDKDLTSALRPEESLEVARIFRHVRNLGEQSPDLAQINKLVKFLKGGNISATIIAVSSLRSFDMKNELNQLAIKDVDGLNPLLALIHTEDSKLSIGSAQILCNASLHPVVQFEIAKLKGIESLVDILGREKRNENGVIQTRPPELKALVCETLAHCATFSTVAAKIRSCGGMKRLIMHIGDQHPFNVRMMAALALWKMADVAQDNRDCIKQFNGVHLLVEMLRREDEDGSKIIKKTEQSSESTSTATMPVVPSPGGTHAKAAKEQHTPEQVDQFIEHAAGCLMACVRDDALRASFRDEGGAELVVERLKDSTGKPQLQGILAGCISAASADEKVRTIVAENGGLAPLGRMLSSSDTDILSRATNAIRTLSKTPANVAILNESGAIAQLVNLMSNEDKTIQRNAASALANCSTHKQGRSTIRSAGGAAKLVNLLEKSTDFRLLPSVCETLAGLAGDPANLKLILNSDALRLLWSLMRQGDDAPETVCHAGLAIRECLKDNVDLSGQIGRTFVNGLPLLVTLMRSEETDVQIGACAAVSEVAKNVQNLRILVEEGLLEALAIVTTSANPKNPMMAENVALAISTCSRDPSNRVVLGELGAVVPIVPFLLNPQPSVMRSVALAMRDLSEDVGNARVLRSANAVAMLLDVMEEADEELQFIAGRAIENIRKGHISLAEERL